ASDPRGLDQYRALPERLEDAAVILVTSQPVGTLRDDRVADRIRLGFGGLLARLLRNRTLLDPDQRFAVWAIANVGPSGTAGFGDTLARFAVDHRVEQNNRTGGVIVPDVVVHLLEVPDVFAGLRLQGDDRGAEQVVALAHRAVIVGAAIADREVNEP